MSLPFPCSIPFIHASVFSSLLLPILATILPLAISTDPHPCRHSVLLPSILAPIHPYRHSPLNTYPSHMPVPPLPPVLYPSLRSRCSLFISTILLCLAFIPIPPSSFAPPPLPPLTSVQSSSSSFHPLPLFPSLASPSSRPSFMSLPLSYPNFRPSLALPIPPSTYHPVLSLL